MNRKFDGQTTLYRVSNRPVEIDDILEYNRLDYVSPSKRFFRLFIDNRLPERRTVYVDSKTFTGICTGDVLEVREAFREANEKARDKVFMKGTP